jgi:hypothetical protein
LTYIFTNCIEKADSLWVVSSSSAGFAAPLQNQTDPSTVLLLEEEPTTGCKRSLKMAFPSPQKSTVTERIVKA